MMRLRVGRDLLLEINSDLTERLQSVSTLDYQGTVIENG